MTFASAQEACPQCRAKAPHVWGVACLFGRGPVRTAEQWSCFNCGLLAVYERVGSRWRWRVGRYKEAVA